MTTTTPTLLYAMSSDDSEDQQTNTKNKWGGGGYSSEDIHQKRSKDSQGKQAFSRQDERNDRACSEKRMRTLEDKLYELEESNKKLKAKLVATKRSTNKVPKAKYVTPIIGQVRKLTWQIKLLNFVRISCFLVTSF